MGLIAILGMLALPTALRGALGFLTRLPVGHDEDAWRAFAGAPASLPLAGYVVGAIVALPVLVPAPAPTVALLYVAGIYLLTGVTHADGVTDLGDAAAVHESAERRREVLKDSAVGTGGVLALALVVLGLASAGFLLARLPPAAAVLVVTAEVGAKLGMATLVCLGTAAHEGLGSSLSSSAGPRSLLPAAVVAVPAGLLSWLGVDPGATGLAATAGAALPSLIATAAAVVVALLVGRWARATLGGVSGDVLGAANELGRIAALHAGVIAWTRF